MLETKKAFEHLGLDTTSPLRAFQDVSEKFYEHPNPKKLGSNILHDMLNVTVSFDDERLARMVTAKVAELLVKADHKVEDGQTIVDEAMKTATAFVANPTHQWMWAKPEAIVSSNGATEQNVVDGLDCKVEVKANGKIKKGGKQIVVAEMYKANVLEAETPMSNQQFVALLMKELKMSKAGATTYTYNVKKQLGEPEGGIEKSAKGRKAA